MTLKQQLERVVKASGTLPSIPPRVIDETLQSVAQAALDQTETILRENARDLGLMPPESPKFDRLKLSAERIEAIASDIRNVASLDSPLGRVQSDDVRPNGMRIRRVSVPFGVIGVIYEARPNVTFDVFSLCLKSGNACVLKGGSDAIHTNTAIAEIIQQTLDRHDIDRNVLALLPADREATDEILHARGYVDLIIPRGSQALIDHVRENATIPVIETGAGVCHTYFDEFGDVEKGRAIVFNAKTRRPSVCNALDCLIVHEKRLADLPGLCADLPQCEVVLEADEKAYHALADSYPARWLREATLESFGTEFLSYRMAVKTVEDMEGALVHIARYGSKHSEAIVSESPERLEIFRRRVDAAAVYCNVSTAFTDGAQFGLGAEIGISTQKLHARGPMGLAELTTYKWLIDGDGQIRPK